MRNGTLTAWLLVSMAAAQTPDPAQLSRFLEKVRQDMAQVPNYTCLETIDRARREPHARAFKPLDKIRVEVSSVGGKELFAWPGARRFDDQELKSMVEGGTTGSGMFALFAHKLFVEGAGTLQYGGAETLDGRAAIRYDFNLTEQDGGLRITADHVSEFVASRGSFWFDASTLDLIRVDVAGDHIPDSLHMEEASFSTLYARAKIGDFDALLPKRSELTMAHFNGLADRNSMDFSQCHEYQTESTIRFNAPSELAAAPPKLQPREVALPAGLLVTIELESPIDSKTVTVGDTLHARVVDEIRYEGELLVPQGARATGHIRKMSRRSGSGPAAVGLDFSEIEWEGAHAELHAELIDLDVKSAGSHKPVKYFDGQAQKALVERGVAGAFVFYIDAAAFRIPPGFHMVWRTLPRSARIEE